MKHTCIQCGKTNDYNYCEDCDDTPSGQCMVMVTDNIRDKFKELRRFMGNKVKNDENKITR
jgi:hypothetical protein